MKNLFLALLLCVGFTASAEAQLGSVTYVFSPTTTARSAEVNVNFSVIHTAALKRNGGGSITGATTVDGSGTLTFNTGTSLTLASGSTVSFANSTATASGVWTFSGNSLVTGSLGFDADALKIADTNASHYLILTPGSDLTANRVLTVTTGDAARTVTFSGNPTLADWFDQSVKVAASPTFVGLTVSGSAASFRGVSYTWPAADGAANAVLTTNGSATLSWAASSTIRSYTATLANVANTVVETTVLSFVIPANTWADGEMITVIVDSLDKNNQGTSKAVTSKVNVGAGAQVGVGAAVNWPNSATEFKMTRGFSLRRQGTTVWVFSGAQGDNIGSAAPATFQYNPSATVDVDGTSTPANFTTDITVSLKLTLEVADATFYYKPQAATILHYKTP